MNTLTARPAIPAHRNPAGRPRSLFDGAGGGPTLDHLVSGAWEELTAHAVVECPLCDGELVPEYGSHALPVAGRCRSCGTTLS